MDRSEGNLNRGFSMKNYPDFYFSNNPNLMPVLTTLLFFFFCSLKMFIFGRFSFTRPYKDTIFFVIV